MHVIAVYSQVEQLQSRKLKLQSDALHWTSAMKSALLQARRFKLLDAPVLLRFIQAFVSPTPESITPYILLW
jgi:hypothetical protein